MRRRCTTLAALLLAGSVHAQSLPSLAIDPSRISVSGLSSGAAMAVQLQVAYSSLFSAAGVVAGVPYGCADSTAWPRLFTATAICMDLPGDFVPFQGPPRAQAAIAAVQAAFDAGGIDDPGLLRRHRVYLFSGTADRTVPGAVMDAVHDFYRHWLPEQAIARVADIAAGHGFVTDGVGQDCAVTASPYLNDCGYDTAGALLAHLHGGPLRAPVEGASTEVFDQRPHGAAMAGMADEGFVYVPPACRDGTGCALHVVLHGCRQQAGAVGRRFVDGAGYLRWAAGNDIVLLFPQVRASRAWPVGDNPRGCWDWWGFSARRYAERDAPQMRAIVSMVRALGGP